MISLLCELYLKITVNVIKKLWFTFINKIPTTIITHKIGKENNIMKL